MTDQDIGLGLIAIKITCFRGKRLNELHGLLLGTLEATLIRTVVHAVRGVNRDNQFPRRTRRDRSH